MPAGKGLQRGFVRGVGIPPSEMDRKNKRAPKVLPGEKGMVEGDVSAKLVEFKELYPDLYAEAEKFARRHDCPQKQTDILTARYVEESLKESKKEQHLQDLLTDYQSRAAAKQSQYI
jgi:hypothetical protein